MRIVVTGGAGFIGSHVVDAYLSAGHEVIVIDNMRTGRRDRVNPAARLVEMDCLDPGLVDLLQEVGPDVVNHHAANASVSVSMQRPIFDLEQNIRGTLNVLEAIRLAAVPRFIYASSGGAMYGNPDYLPADEAHPSNPVSPYALSKHTGERYARLYGLEHGLQWTSLRYANVYGPRQDPLGEAGVVAIFCQDLQAGKKPEIHWDGEQSRDFVYVKDCARANVLVLEQGYSQAYNIGTGVGTSINQLLATLLDVTGKAVKPKRGPRRPGDARHSYLEYTKAKTELGWQPETSLREGLARTWEYYTKSDGA
jgi:UDP-glucose 4-epimerase